MGKRCLTLVLALLLALSLSACDSRPGTTDPTSSGGGSSSPPMPAPFDATYWTAVRHESYNPSFGRTEVSAMPTEKWWADLYLNEDGTALFREALGFGYASYLINAEWWLGADNALRLTGEDLDGSFISMDGRKEKDGSVMLETPYGNRFYFEPAERPVSGGELCMADLEGTWRMSAGEVEGDEFSPEEMHMASLLNIERWWSDDEGGYYEDMEGDWWDICGNIDIGADKTGVVRLWDEDYSRDSLMAKVNVTLSTAGTGEHGTMTSEDGQFTDIAIEHADWIVDPGLADRDDLICIDGYYENGDDEFYYEIYLRPWGTYWDDADEDSRPKSYDDWYLPLIKAGKSMPDAIGADAPASSGDTKSTAPSGNSNAPSGTGLVSEEAVQKGYVWMNEVNNNIFDTTYEGLVDYFGVEGEFVKEEYSDHMKRNQRYYKWVSKDDPSHYVYVNFAEEEPGVYKVSAFNTSGFSGKEAIEKYLDTVKAEAAEADKAATANTKMKDFAVTVTQFAHDDVAVKITTKIPESGWSYDEGKKCLVENDDPTAFGAGAIRFEVRANVEDFDYYKDDFENYQDTEDGAQSE